MMWPPPTVHYTANDSAGPAAIAAGYNVVDVSDPGTCAGLPAGIRGLVYVGDVTGATASFKSFVNSFKPIAHKVFGFWLADGQGLTSGAANLANLKAESDYIHSVYQYWWTYVRLGNNDSSLHPSFVGGATYPNTHVDLFGIDAYPCRVGDTYPIPFTGCNLEIINATYNALKRDLPIPDWRIVPTFQAFGIYPGGDDCGGNWALPTPTQAQSILDRWKTLLPHPIFDYTYSWGQQGGDLCLSNASSALKQVFINHNKTS